MQAMPQAHISAPSCMLNIQPSPHCFNSLNKKTTTLHQTLHNTLTTHSKQSADLGGVGGLAASYTQTSTDSDSSLLS